MYLKNKAEIRRWSFSFLTLLFTLLIWNTASAQFFRGEVLDQNEQAIPGVTVSWMNFGIEAQTDEKGVFNLALNDSLPLPIFFVARYQDDRDTFKIDHFDTYWVFKMKASLVLEEVLVQGERSGSFISKLLPIKTEIINRAELRKAACCDLAGCFETQTTVQPQTTNILTNAKELRILGLSGIYNQVLIDGMPLIQGLSYTYGISTIPGSVVENIWVTKGTNSVLQGYESISGQINVILQNGEKADPLYLNTYINSFGEKHLNVNASIHKSKWNSFLAFHTVQPAERIDKDSDTFLDLPLLTRYMILNKWYYGSKTADGWSILLGLRYTDEKRVGGQVSFDQNKDLSKTDVYGQFVQFQQPELYTNTAFRFDAKHKLTFIGSVFQQNQNSWFGVTNYIARQRNVYGNIQFELDWGKLAQHNFKAGFSFRHLNLNEEISFSADTFARTFDGKYFREENIPGLFMENTFRIFEKITWILGVRADHHNDFGWYITPRSLIRYAAGKNTDIRASIGTGWRTVNLFSENINLLTGGRDIVFTDALKPEHAINMGLSVVQQWESQNANYTITADFYQTVFQNQVFPDYDAIPLKVVINNFNGRSVSNGFQLEGSIKLIKQWDFKLSYNFLDVYREINNQKVELPFNANHRLLGVISYRPISKIWQADINMHWYGSQKLPDTKNYPEAFRRADKSNPYSLISIQFTRTFKQLEVYAGCENVFDFRQNKPILSWQNPFGPYFDTSFAWGPTRGREFYLGFRLILLKDKKNISL